MAGGGEEDAPAAERVPKEENVTRASGRLPDASVACCSRLPATGDETVRAVLIVPAKELALLSGAPLAA